jgi:hypothetical protein
METPANNSPSEPQNENSGRTDNDRRIFADLREISAAAHKWQTELTAILDAPPSTSEGQQSTISEQTKRKPQVDVFVRTGIASIRDIFEHDLREHEWGAAVLVDLDLGWQDIDNQWTLDPHKPERALDTIRLVRDKLDGIVYTCLAITLAPDINDRLLNLDVGQPLDLEFVYGQDFPRDSAMRKRLILEVAQERKVIASGCFDAETGVIYRIAPTLKERRRCLWHVSGLILLGVLLAAGACFVGLLLPAWPIKAYRYSTLANYVSLFFGAGAHLLIQALKQNRAQTKPSFTAMDDWLLWLHVHEKPVLYGILWADLGFLLLTFMVHGMDWRGAFAAGYSIDSITDLFLTKFEAVIGNAATQLKKAAA